MMCKIRLFVAAVVGLKLAYLLLWPIPLSPASWDAPDPPNLVGGDFNRNLGLWQLELLDIGNIHGPEDVAFRNEGGGLWLYISSQKGKIVRLNPATGEHSQFAETGGVPLGLEFDAGGNLIVADAFRGLLSVSPAGEVTVLAETADGLPIKYADDLDITPDGIIYFSDASTKFGAQPAGSTMNGSLMEIMEHGRTGRVLAYDPQTGATETVMADLAFSNGIAADPDGAYILVVETAEYRVLKHWLTGPRAGQADVIVDNLPGFPDNINRGPVIDGAPTYFVGLVSQRSDILDRLSDKPFWRKVVWRLPAFLKPAAKSYGYVLQIDGTGNVLKTWQDPSGAYPLTTGAIAPGDGYLYVTSLGADKLGRRPFE